MTTSAGPAVSPGELAIAIDVGNSKTHVTAIDRSGELFGAVTGPGLFGLPRQPRQQLDTLLDLVEEMTGHRSGFEAACFAMAGLDIPQQEAEMAQLVEEAGVAGRIVVRNDTFALLRTGSPSGDGVAVIAGAGINCVAVQGDAVVRFHSMGRKSGDWGGGWHVGEAALFAASRAQDGRGAPTVLAQRIAEHFDVQSPLDVAEAIELGRLDDARLVELAPLTFVAAEEGDTAAVAIVARLADEVRLFVEVATRRLGATHDELPILLGGGLLQSGSPLLLRLITSPQKPGAQHLRVTVSDVPPIIGAVLLALDVLPDREAPTAQSLAAQFLRLSRR